MNVVAQVTHAAEVIGEMDARSLCRTSTSTDVTCCVEVTDRERGAVNC